MDKKELEARAEHRRKLAEGPSLTLAEEIAKAWMDLVIGKGWDPRVQPQVPEGIPVGPEFENWIDLYLKRSRFRFREFDGAIKLTAREVARVIDTAGNRLVGRDFPNPLTGIRKEKGEGGYTVVGSNEQAVKTADTIYGPVKYPDRHRNMYTSPFEWTRYCPQHAGVMLHRLPGGIYQCPMTGDTFSYTNGHPVEYRMGVQNQTNPNWNDTFPQKAFLTTPNQQSTRASGGIYDEDAKAKLNQYKKEEPTDVKPTTQLYAKAKGFTKKAAGESMKGIRGPARIKYDPETVRMTGKSDAMTLWLQQFLGGQLSATQARKALDMLRGMPDEVQARTFLNTLRREMALGTSPEAILSPEGGSKQQVKTGEQKFEIESKVFGPPQVKTRYCPDHEGVMTYRISDDVHQCPIDRAIYDFAQGFKTQDGREFHGGSVAEMTPDRPDFYQSPHPFLVVDSSVKQFVRTGARLRDERERQTQQETREQQKSGLREYQGIANKWVEPTYPLAEAKTEFKSIVEKVLDAKSLPKALAGIEKARSGQELARHFFDLLLKHEGQGVIRAGKKQEKRAYSNLENRFIFDLSHVLTSGSEDSKKVMKLVIDNVMRRGQTLPEAIRDAYTVVDQSSLQPAQTMEVTEEPTLPPKDSSETSLSEQGQFRQYPLSKQ